MTRMTKSWRHDFENNVGITHPNSSTPWKWTLSCDNSRLARQSVAWRWSASVTHRFSALKSIAVCSGLPQPRDIASPSRITSLGSKQRGQEMLHFPLNERLVFRLQLFPNLISSILSLVEG